MMQDPLSRFEDRIQRLVEGGFARLFAGHLHPREVAVLLARAMEDHARGHDGERVAPDIYIVRLNPADHRAILSEHPDTGTAMAGELVEMAREVGLVLNQVPDVRILADQSVEPQQVIISAQHSTRQLESTQAMPLSKAGSDSESPAAPHAVLVTSSDQQIPLDTPIINLGRQRDNEIIVDDAHVSRHHAQIRLRFGRYVLFDLGSSGGTTVNGHPVREAILQSGDVIGLAGASLIYVEDGEPGDMDADRPGTQPSLPTPR